MNVSFPQRLSAGRRCGFTMVEIALCLGVIAIALVAIIGVLPSGLRVQQENREDSILNQDALYLIEAMRGGRYGRDPADHLEMRVPDWWPSALDELTNLVLAVAVTNIVDGAQLFFNPLLVAPADVRPFGKLRVPFQARPMLTNGLHMVGLLSRPKLEVRNNVLVTNYVAALMRSISGPVLEKAGSAREFAFTYVVTSEVLPLGNYPSSWLDYRVPGLSAEEVLVRSNRWLMALNQGANFSDLRLALHGPAFETKRDGVARWETAGAPRVFRTLLSGRQYSYQVYSDDERFVVSLVQPGAYRRVVR